MTALFTLIAIGVVIGVVVLALGLAAALALRGLHRDLGPHLSEHHVHRPASVLDAPLSWPRRGAGGEVRPRAE